MDRDKFMAANKKRIMVLHEEGATAHMALPSAASPPDLLGTLNTKQGSAVIAIEKANIAATSTPNYAMGVGQIAPTLNSNTISDNQPENLSPESTCRGIKIILDNNNMWNEFFRCKTEMILTKQGRRMFPYCRFRISGLDPFQKYTLLMDINPVDNKRYKWTGQDWKICGKGEAHLQRQVFIHPDSPSSGHQWMQNPVSFYKLKLTDNHMDQDGNIILHPMHRYLPHLHVVSAETATENIQFNGPDVITFTFPQTEFFAVTAYQNIRMSQFKADFNPFASGPNSWALKMKMSPSNESKKDEIGTPTEVKPLKGLNGLKSLMAAKRNSKDISTVDKGHLSADARHLTPAVSEKISPSELKIVRGLGGLKSLMAKHNSKDTPSVHEGLITSNAVTLAGCDKPGVNTDGPRTRLKSILSNEINQSPNEPNFEKNPNNFKSMMTECTSTDNSAAGQRFLTSDDCDIAMVKTSSLNESKDKTRSISEQKPGKCLNNLKSLMVKRKSKDTSAVDQVVLSKDGQNVTLADSENSEVGDNRPDSNAVELKSGPCNELEKTETTYSKDFNPLQSNLRYLIDKRNSKDISPKYQGLVSCDAKTLNLIKCDESEVKDLYSSSKKSTPSKTKKDEIISPKTCKPVKNTRKYSRGKCYSQKTSAAGESAQTATVVDIAKSASNIQSTDQNDGTTGPSQRNFSELIRECHLKIIRCNVEITNTAVEQMDNKGMVAQGLVVKVAANDNLGETIEKVGTQNNMTTTDTFTSIVNSSQSEEPVKTLVSTHNHSADEVENSQTATHSSVCSEGKRTGEQQQGKSKPHKRPEPVPLPLLALYLQQLKSKSRPVRTKPKPLTVSPPSLSSYSTVPIRDAVNPAINPTGQATDSIGPVKDCTSPANDPIGCAIPPASDPLVPSTDPTDPAIVPLLPAISPTGQSTNVSKPNPDSFDPATDAFLPEPHLVLPTTDQLFIVPEPTISRSSPMPCLPATVMSPKSDPLLSAPDSFAPAPVLSSPCQEQPSDVPVTLSLATDLTPLNSDPVSNSSEVSSTPGLSNLKLESTPLLPSSGLSLSGFEPASLPDLEPTLPSPATVKPMSAPSIPASSFPGLERLPASNPFVLSSELSSQASLLGLPAPDPFLTTPYIPLLSSSHFNPLPFGGASFSSTSHPGLPALDNAQPSPSPDPASSFQVNSEPLTRPSTPSPLPFQLSPFSSLGPDPLSPTPSLADLTHFFSISDELEITEDFPSSDATPVSCSTVPTLSTASVPVSSTLPVGSVQPVKSNKPRRSRKRSRKVSKSTTADPLPVIGGPTDVTMQPNLEEVEEQLFVSFTSKEALEVHLGEPAICETTTEQPQKTSEATNVERDTTDEIIAAFEKVLFVDLKIMKHRQVIHPVLQEVGLKMSLLDPTLVIDLQYLGVRLPLPPPIPCSEPSSVELASSPGGSVPFVSRTGKTTDFTQIKGWREKLVPVDSPSSSKAEAGPSSDVVRKNLSAFCSDMLDEYLANEGKLIDERAASFNQTAVVTPVTYQLPTKSTSYVRTLDSVLKKQAPPTTFTPPSKKPRLPLASKGPKKSEKTEKRQQRPRTSQKRDKPSAGPTVIPAPLPIKPPQLMDNAAPVTQDDPDTNLKRRKRKPRVKSPPPSKDSLVSRPEVEVPPPAHLAPVEDDHSDPEPASAQNRVVVPGLTKALVRQRDLEDGVVWEGEHRTCITQVRATIALTSLFTSTGFVCENPTAPIKIKCRAPPCLNAFCRLGCVCASLAQDRRITHCGKIDCIFGCSCLRQKVVVLKNLKGPQFSPPEEGSSKKRKKRKRMRMAYTLREAETVSEPAVRVRTLWKQTDGEIDPEPLHAPTPVHLPWIPLQEEPSSAGVTHELVKKDGTMSCARVRVFQVKSTNRPEDNADQYEVSPSWKSKSLSHSQPFTEPSKRLEIVSDCKWRSLADRNLVLRIVCEHMAQDHLTNTFWFKGYLIKPVSQTLKNDGETCCIHYKVHISQGPRPEGVEEENCEEEEWMREEDEETQMEEGEVEEPRDDVEEGQSVKKVGEKHITKENMTVVKRMSLKWKGLPFLNGVSPAGLLTANLKLTSTSDQELVTVNGRSYPHAKIQLGRMGAIHPANRLAAYLTERLRWPVGLETSMSSHENPSATAEDFEGLTNTSSSMEQPGQLAASLTTSVATVTTTSVATVTTTSVSSDTPVAASPKSIVTHLPQAGEDFTYFVEKQISSSQQKLPLTSDPSKSLGSILQPEMPSTPLSTSLVEAASSRSSSDTSSTGDDGSSRKAFPCTARVIRIPAPSTTVRIQCPPPPPSPNLSSPLTSPRTGQRVVLQQVRSTSGATLFRNPSGQLIQLVPLSQLQALNPNLVMRNTGGMISLTTPACLASGSTAAVTCSPSTTSLAAPPSKGLVSMASTITSAPLLSVSLPKLPTSTTYTAIAPKATPHQVTASLPGSKLFHASTISLSPTETNGETYSLKIVPQTGNKEPIIIKCPKVPTQPTQGPSKVLPVVGGLTVLEPSPKFTVITVISPTKNVPDTGVKADSVSTVDTGVDPKVTSDVYSWMLPRQKSTPTPTTAKPPMSVKAPISHQFKFIKSNAVTAVPKTQSEVVRVLQPIPKLVNPPLSPVKKTAVKANTILKTDLNVNTPKVVGVHHPLQMCTRPQKKKELEALDMTEDEDDSDSTDRETNEKTDNSSDDTDSSDSIVNKEALIDVINKQLQHNVLERNRRHELQERFNRLRDSLQMDQKASKISILENAKEKIEDLTKRSRNEEKLKESLTLKRDAHLKKMSHLTGASEEQILRNIQYVSQEKIKTLHRKSENLGTKVSSAVSSPSVDTTCIESEPKPRPSPPACALSKDNTKETQEMDREEVMEVVDLCEDTQDVIEVVDLLEDREEVMEVVDLREDPEEEEKTDNSSDETEDSEDDNHKNKAKGDVINISDVEESSVQEMAVDIETVEDKTHESITPQIEANVTKEVEGAAVPKFKNWDRYLRNRGVELRKSLKALKETLVLDEPAPIDEVVLGQAGKRVHDLRNECELLEKQKSVLNKEKTAFMKKITPKSGKKYELIPKKLQDISTKQKNMANGKWSEVSPPAPSSSTPPAPSSSTPPSASSSTPPAASSSTPPAPSSSTPPAASSSTPSNTTTSTSSTKLPDPKFPTLKLKVVSAPVPPQLAPQQSKMSPITTPPTKKPAARWRPLSERTRPNILSRRKPQPPPDLPRVNSGFLPPQMLSIVGGVVPCQQVITMSPLHPPGSLLPVGRVTGMEMQQSLTPGVASVTISIPSMSQPISLTPPSNVHNRGVPHIANVISLVNVPPVQAVPGVSGGPQRRLSPVKGRGSRLEQGKVLEKQSRAVEINTGSTHESEDEEGGEDDTLKSLLSEIVFLNQLTNDSNSGPGGPAVVNCTPLTEPVEAGTDRETSPHPEKEVIRDGDDERSLSPLFLRLDEDLLGPKEGKGPDEVAVKGLPQPQDLKVCLGAHLKPSEGSGASAAVNGHSPQLQGLACAAKGQGGALTPPPLLQMKVGGGTKVIESNEKPVDTLAPPPLVQMRPMPRLTPLGLKSNSPM